VLAALVCLSRVYVGVHYPLDVLGGAVVGIAAAALVLGAHRWAARRFSRRVRPKKAFDAGPPCKV
jgi:undecaprenyl-diphosphatase